MAEEAGIYEVLDCTVSVGLCNVVTASGCGSGRDRHSAVDVGGTATASNVFTTWASLTSGMTGPRVVVSQRGDVSRISIEVSEGDEGKGWVAVGLP